MKQFKEIFDAFYPKVYGYALKAGGQEWLAEEIAHNVFCKLWMHRDNLSLKGKDDKEVMSIVSSYLFVVTHNEVNNYFRECRQIEQLRENFAVQLCCESRIEQTVDAKTTLGIIDRVVEGMPAVRKEVFTLSRYHNMTNESIAKRLKISKRTVEKHISLALGQLRLELAAYQI